MNCYICIFQSVVHVAESYITGNRIETSVCGAEFVAMKIGMESLRGLRYKLCMMGVGISGPSYIYGNNMLVIYNT